MSLSHVAIIILNWNGWNDTIECLESLYQINYPNYDIIVIDNKSKDNSVRMIKEYCSGRIKIKSKFFEYNPNNKPINIFECTNYYIENNIVINSQESFVNLPSNKKLHLILNDKNYFFTNGNNIGIKYIIKFLKSDFILLLNNDTVVENNFLLEMIEVSNIHKKIGILGPRVCLYNNPTQNQYAYLQNIKKPSIECDFISGTALLFKTELIKRIGLLDSRFIHYTEDKDYCYSARKAGYIILYVPTKSKVLHKGAVSMNKVKGMQLYFKTRNNFLFKRKHLSNFLFIHFLFRFFIITFLLELIRYSKEIKCFIKGVKDGIFFIIKNKSLLLKK